MVKQTVKDMGLGGLVLPSWLEDIIGPKWREFDAAEYDCPMFLGTSGGKTSGLMTALVLYYSAASSAIDNVVATFQNTGGEHRGTYTYLKHLSSSFAGFLHWLEFRKPERYGAPPREARYAMVDFDSASRRLEPMTYVLETLAEFREVEKGYPPVAPNPTARLCTAYAKVKTQTMFVRDVLGAESSRDVPYNERFVGIRADEVHRFHKLSARDSSSTVHRAPLAAVGITKEHVNRFWAEQPYTLEIPENLGNCTLCFLKDYADLAHNMKYECEQWEIDWWLAANEKYGNMIGVNKGMTYVQIRDTADVRFDIVRPALLNGDTPVYDEKYGMSARDFKLLVRQERRVLKEGIVRIPCSCESADLMTDDYVLEAQ